MILLRYFLYIVAVALVLKAATELPPIICLIFGFSIGNLFLFFILALRNLYIRKPK